ncbi:PREDICTED: uncharacterized protein LOC104604205 [Nelumbo nucifera]|uniref:Uncharacterized protein LOC104604205 n=1 Tax=Nelumbo nucifera TaxID=4432 RepID=A0A1U8AHX7_NELNU|nr:PREDICTED: uncharacterized protein LOC104604205 [Nelumbo nucifera]
MKILTDNGLSIKNQEVCDLIGQYSARLRISTTYYPQGNGQTEATNKTLLRMLSKTVADNQKDWTEKLSETLWTYHTTIRKRTQAMPYSLVYGQEAVLPAEIRAVSAQVAFAMDKKVTPEDMDHLFADKLEVIDEARNLAMQKHTKYKQALATNFNRLLRPRNFKEGDKVLKMTINVRHGKSAGKFTPTWEGPYVIKEAHALGYYVLKTVDIEEDDETINGYWLKPYF